MINCSLYSLLKIHNWTVSKICLCFSTVVVVMCSRECHSGRREGRSDGHQRAQDHTYVVQEHREEVDQEVGHLDAGFLERKSFENFTNKFPKW